MYNPVLELVIENRAKQFQKVIKCFDFLHSHYYNLTTFKLVTLAPEQKDIIQFSILRGKTGL